MSGGDSHLYPDNAALRQILEQARDFIDPDRDPPRINNRKLVMKINAVLSRTDAQRLSEQQRHAIEHARYQVKHASPDDPECCFDYQLVETLVEMLDRAYPLSSTNCGGGK